MPLKNYGVLKGRLKERRHSGKGWAHYQLRLVAAGADYRAAVNVRSMLHPSEVEYLVVKHFEHPITDELRRLEAGFHPLRSRPGGRSLDYIRLNLFSPAQFRTLPCEGPECGGDLNEVLDRVFLPVLRDPAAWVYTFGEPWGPAQATDRVFRFFPSRGIHEVHMNQGNDPSHWEQDAVWQDGAVLIEHPRRQHWVGIFLKFQSQSWHTDEATGHALAPPKSYDPSGPHTPRDRFGAPHPDGMVRIIAATVLSGSVREARRGGESITLANVCPFPVEIEGWALANHERREWKLKGELAVGEVREIPLGRSVPLGVDGGIITLLNKQGLKVDGASYTAERACREHGRLLFEPTFFTEGHPHYNAGNGSPPPAPAA